MDRKKTFQFMSGILSGIATIIGASSVFQTASTAHAITLTVGAFGLGATVASLMFHKRHTPFHQDE